MVDIFADPKYNRKIRVVYESGRTVYKLYQSGQLVYISEVKNEDVRDEVRDHGDEDQRPREARSS